MRKTKWMAAVLSVCLILVMLPTVAFAEGHAKSTGNAEHDNPFGDIHEGDYYYDAVLWAVEQGITSGTSATTFSPDTSCTRSQMVTFLWRSAGSPHAQYTVSPFEDVSSDTYYYEAVIWAAEQGITSGTSSTTFSPDTPRPGHYVHLSGYGGSRSCAVSFFFGRTGRCLLRFRCILGGGTRSDWRHQC